METMNNNLYPGIKTLDGITSIESGVINIAEDLFSIEKKFRYFSLSFFKSILRTLFLIIAVTVAFSILMVIFLWAFLLQWSHVRKMKKTSDTRLVMRMEIIYLNFCESIYQSYITIRDVKNSNWMVYPVYLPVKWTRMIAINAHAKIESIAYPNLNYVPDQKHKEELVKKWNGHNDLKNNWPQFDNPNPALVP